MTLFGIGAVLALLIGFMWWRGHLHLFGVLVPLALGLVLARIGLTGLMSGLHSTFTAFATLVSSAK